jgi:hypothetical protein
MAPLTDLISEVRFEWHPVHKEVCVYIYRLASEILVLRPISYTLGELIFLFTVVFKVGVGTCIGQGPTPAITIPASFIVRNLLPHNYTTLFMNLSL